MKLSLWLALLIALPGWAADVKTTDLPAASALGGTEVFPSVQSATSKKATIGQVSTYVRSQVTKSDVGLGNAENTALSTWAGSSALTTLGTVATGTWQGTPIAFSYLSLTKSDLGLGSVENTALSTWTGTANITTLGTIGTGSWNATAIPFGKGGTGLTSAADDTTLVSSGSAWVAKTLPDCTDTGGNHLNYTQSTNTFSCGTLANQTISTVNVTGSGAPSVGIYRPLTNFLGFTTQNAFRGGFDANGAFQINYGFNSQGTKFTASGCSNSSTVGGAVAGQFASGTTGTCTVVITLPASPNGWACSASDISTPANLISQSATSTTSCTITGSTTSGDTIVFKAMGY